MKLLFYILSSSVFKQCFSNIMFYSIAYRKYCISQINFIW